MGEVDVQIETSVPSTGNDCVKKASSAGAPWNTTSVEDWRGFASKGAA